MPRCDGTGPMGQGSMTGRGLGYCSGNARAGFANNGFGYFGLGRGGRAYGCGMGRGFGGGRGRGRGFGFWNRPRFGNIPYEYSQPNPEQEKRYLKEDIKELESELSEMKKYLSEIEKEKNKE